jgi:hypothetical protein
MSHVNGKRANELKRPQPRVRTIQDIRDAAARYRGEILEDPSDADPNDEQPTQTSDEVV